MTKNEHFVDQLETMLKANMTPWVITHEEERFIHSLRLLAPRFKGAETPLSVLIWSASEGLLDYTDYITKNKVGNYGKVKKVMMIQEIIEPMTERKITREAAVFTFDQFISYARQENDNTLFVVKDIHHTLEPRKANYLEQGRKIRDLIHAIRATSAWLALLSTNDAIPADLEKEIQALDMPLPDPQEVQGLLDDAIRGFQTLPRVKINVNAALRERIVFNLLGLTEVEICQVLNYTCVKHTGLGEAALHDIKEMKRAIIEKGGYLQFISTPEEIEIGGHDRFKEYVAARGLYLNQRFREHFNLKAPKGVCLVGPPGGGKSLFARYIGYKWQLPLIRVDMGAIYGEKLGQSEGRLRDALRIAEANAPCILWIDEIEKAIGGLGTHDSGTTMRIFGKLLTWMAERQEMIYLYCTANNIDALPPELTRAGRLDSIWWGDLPLEKDCIDIVKIHCKMNKVSLSDSVYRELGQEAFKRNLTGAEIEHAVIESLYTAAHESNRLRVETPLGKAFILKAMEDIRPYAIRKAAELKKSRIEALDKFEFTSTEAKQRVEKIAGDQAAIRSEFHDE